MTYHNYTTPTYLTPENLCILRMQGSLTPYLKLGGCAAYLLITCPDCQRDAPPVTRPRIALDPVVLAAMQCMPEALAGDGGTVYWPLGLVWRRLRVPREQRTWLKLQLSRERAGSPRLGMASRGAT
jgi:hypothetical protein